MRRFFAFVIAAAICAASFTTPLRANQTPVASSCFAPNTISNGQTLDAGPVQQNFNYLQGSSNYGDLWPDGAMFDPSFSFSGSSFSYTVPANTFVVAGCRAYAPARTFSAVANATNYVWLDQYGNWYATTASSPAPALTAQIEYTLSANSTGITAVTNPPNVARCSGTTLAGQICVASTVTPTSPCAVGAVAMGSTGLMYSCTATNTWTLPASIAPIFNAGDPKYGTLDPTGVADAAATINAAGAACNSAGGGTVFIPQSSTGGAATYSISSNHIIPYSNCSIAGPGNNLVTLKLANASNGGIVYSTVTSGFSNITISNLTLDLNGQVNQDGISIIGVKNSAVRLDRVRAINANGRQAVVIGNILDAPACTSSSCVAPTTGQSAAFANPGTYYVTIAYTLNSTDGAQSLEATQVVTAGNTLTVACPTPSGTIAAQGFSTSCDIFAGTTSGGETLQGNVATGATWTMPSGGLVAGTAWSYSACSTDVSLSNVVIENSTYNGASEPTDILGTCGTTVTNYASRNITNSGGGQIASINFYGYDFGCRVQNSTFDSRATSAINGALYFSNGSDCSEGNNTFYGPAGATSWKAISVSNESNLLLGTDDTFDEALNSSGTAFRFSDFAGTTFDTQHVMPFPNTSQALISGAHIVGGFSYVQIGDSAAGHNYAQQHISINGGDFSGAYGLGIEYIATQSTAMGNFVVQGVHFGPVGGTSGSAAAIGVVGASGMPFSNASWNGDTFNTPGHYAFSLDGTNVANNINAFGNDVTNAGTTYSLLNGATLSRGNNMAASAVTGYNGPLYANSTAGQVPCLDANKVLNVSSPTGACGAATLNATSLAVGTGGSAPLTAGTIGGSTITASTQFTGSGAGLTSGTVPNAALATLPVTGLTCTVNIVCGSGATPTVQATAAPSFTGTVTSSAANPFAMSATGDNTITSASASGGISFKFNDTGASSGALAKFQNNATDEWSLSSSGAVTQQGNLTLAGSSPGIILNYNGTSTIQNTTGTASVIAFTANHDSAYGFTFNNNSGTGPFVMQFQLGGVAKSSIDNAGCFVISSSKVCSTAVTSGGTVAGTTITASTQFTGPGTGLTVIPAGQFAAASFTSGNCLQASSATAIGSAGSPCDPGYTVAGAALASTLHTVFGTCVFSSSVSCTPTAFSSSAVFASATSYACTVSGGAGTFAQTGALSAGSQSTTGFTITAGVSNSQTVTFICTGT